MEARFIIARLYGPNNNKYCRLSKEGKLKASSFMEKVKLELDLQDGWNLNR